MKKVILGMICILLLVAMVSCSQSEHVHSFDSYVDRVATCGTAGSRSFTCTVCGYNKSEVIPATNDHTFGTWTQSSATSMFRTCTVCGTVETVPLAGIGGSNDSPSPSNPGNNENPAAQHSYTSFSSFLQDCIVDGSKLTYNGLSNKINISLSGRNATDSCDDKTIMIPARVTDIQFIGLASGSPLSNLKIVFEERVNDINVTFNDVRIESKTTIMDSQSRNINVNMKMLGNTCSFIVIGKGAKGADGSDGATNDTSSVFGKAGGNGASAFTIKGNITINSEASLLEIKGGDGGNGGAGGHIVTSSAPSGGDGGNGGDAISGEELAVVNVASGCTANIQGGVGGNGGAGGESEVGYFGTNRHGDAGDPGQNGITGCDIVYQ